MLDYIKTIYPHTKDPRVDYLEGLERDSIKRHDVLQQREDIYAALQEVLGADTPDPKRLRDLNDQLEKLRDTVSV